MPVSVDEIRAYATNGLPIGDDVLAPHLVPARVIGFMESWNLRVITLPMVELCEKAGGASRCLVSQARVDAPGSRSPTALDYRAQRQRILADA